MSTRTLSASGRTLLIWADTRWVPLSGIVEGMDDARLAAGDGRQARDGRADLGALDDERVEVGVARGHGRAAAIHQFAYRAASRLERGDAVGQAHRRAHLRSLSCTNFKFSGPV